MAVLEQPVYIVYNTALLFISGHNMNDTKQLPALPDRLSGNSRSPWHVADVFEHNIGIKLNGKERFDVEEYCISDGWVKISSPKSLDRRGQPLLLTLKGVVEAFYK